METVGNTTYGETPNLLALVAEEPRPTPPDRPWVVLNMVASVDGASAGTDGRSGSLSGPDDRALFAALRAVADVVLAGASTVRVENYGAPRLPEGAAELRATRGQSSLPRLAVVSASLDLDPRARFFQEPPADQPPIVLTGATAPSRPPARTADLDQVAEVRIVGQQAVDWPAALGLLRADFGAQVLLVEGGPTVNGQLVDLDLVDELCLTVAPQLNAGSARRIVGGVPLAVPHRLSLARALESDGFLLLRYLRDRA